MTHPDPLDELLRAHYTARRMQEQVNVPAFDQLVQATPRAHRTVRGAMSLATSARVVPPTSRWRHLAWAVPLAACLTLAARLDLSTPVTTGADAEFEALVAGWARTTSTLGRTPTDVLLDAPGRDLLRGTPRLPTGSLSVTRSNPS